MVLFSENSGAMSLRELHAVATRRRLIRPSSSSLGTPLGLHSPFAPLRTAGPLRRSHFRDRTTVAQAVAFVRATGLVSRSF